MAPERPGSCGLRGTVSTGIRHHQRFDPTSSRITPVGAPTGGGELDDEPTGLDDLSVRLTEPQWRRFELDVAALTAKMDPAAVVQHDQTAIRRVSGRRRQVDVLVSGFIGGCPLSVAIECKSSPKPLEISAVDEFAGKLIDLGVDRGVLYTAGRHTTGAQARAAGATQPKIELRHLSPELPDPPWRSGLPELFTGFGDCPNDNCYTGDISWRPWPQTRRSDRRSRILRHLWHVGGAMPGVRQRDRFLR